MTQTTKYDIFVSYSRQDNETVDMICKHLEDNNISYFRDIYDISIGSTFTQTITDAILSCKLMLFIASKHSFASSYTSKEVTFAYQNHVAILPLLTDNTIMPTHFSFMFSDVQCMSLDNTPMPRLISDIKHMLAEDATDKPTPQPVRNTTKPAPNTNGKHNRLTITILTITLLLAAVGIAIYFTTSESDTATSEITVTESNTAPAPKEIVITEGDYYNITSSRKLTEEDIKGLSRKELSNMRNEIYARHGYIFDTEKIHYYFSQKSWYKPEKAYITESEFSEIEMHNIRFIQLHEK